MNPRAAWALALVGATALAGPASRPARAQGTPSPTAPAAFYDARAPMALTLTADFASLRRDRQDDPPWRAATVGFTDSAGAPVTLPARVRARGLWRRRNCEMPPLRLDFARSVVAPTPLAGVNRPKLVQFCQDARRPEQYVLSEFQLYRIYALLTPVSHKARLLRVTYVDSSSRKVRTTRHAFLLEEPQALARRLGGRELDIKGSVSDDLDERTRVVMGVFQYMIGNTDWSSSGLHNVELFAIGAVIYPVAYDFDHSGAVDAHYALPPPQLPIRTVRQRLFRGACGADTTFTEVFEHFRANREAIYALYSDEVGRLMDPGVVRRTLRYFDEFYAILDDPRTARREILDRCAASQ
ncbi:MAG: hypothetical protein H0X64_07070 [Gemmatimonadaceae bacterium]|nr:hypothetical protein [Gemmatimonadaceae bacterium]